MTYTIFGKLLRPKKRMYPRGYFLILAMVAIILFVAKTSANLTSPDVSIKNYLVNNKIEQVEVSFKEDTATVVFHSIGIDRVTVDDVKSIRLAMNAVRTKSLTGKVHNLNIQIINQEGAIIYEALTKDVSNIPYAVGEDYIDNSISMREAKDILLDTLLDSTIYKNQEDQIYFTAADTEGSMESIEVTESKQSGYLVRINYKITSNSYLGVNELIASVHQSIEELIDVNSSGILQSEIYVYYKNNELVYYFTGDYLYASYYWWQSPMIDGVWTDNEPQTPH